ncbi:hypothetical protein HYR69_10130 [Candidatus Sumerlaeota bacterium]|nr:hypothetical protein [Candidatus Sumerlaeota bacterium]
MRIFLASPAIAGIAMIAACKLFSTPADKTILQFPSKTSMGKILVRKAGDPALDTYAAPPDTWRELKEARGKVVIPPGMDVKLEIPYEQKISLAPLRKLGPDSIQSVQLGGSKIGDREFLALRNLTGLQMIFLRSPQITDNGLAAVREMKELKSLELWWCNVTDSGLQNLAGLRKLRNLVLVGARISDAGAENLSQLTELETLWLSETPIGDHALVYLAGMKSLKTLYIRNTRVSDDGVESLAALPSLRQIDLSWTEISGAGLERLRAKRPGLAIVYDRNPNPRPQLKQPPARRRRLNKFGTAMIF